MIAILQERVFASTRTNQLELLKLISVCESGRHVLVTNPPYVPGGSPILDAWLEDLPLPVGAHVRLLLEFGLLELAGKTAAAPRIRVSDVTACNWESTEPVLTVEDAARLLNMPLKLLVENRRNDGAFLRKLTPPSYRAVLERALERGWVELENGGGIGELRRRVEEAQYKPMHHTRLWVMVDSDAREPDKPSGASDKVIEACLKVFQPWPLPARQLRRRSIENYLPLKSLQGWASRKGANGREVVDSFIRLSQNQRHHFNMKSGFLGDLKSEKREQYRARRAVVEDADLPPLFQRLSLEDKRALQEGFGSSIGDLFHDEDGVALVAEEHLQSEVPDHERTTLVQSILERI